MLNVETRVWIAHQNHGAVLAGPPECCRASGEGGIDFATNDALQHQGFKAGIPCSARFRRSGINLGRGEGHFSGVAQRGLAHIVSCLCSGQAGKTLFDEVNSAPDHIDGLFQRDGTGEISWRSVENLNGYVGSWIGMAVPINERGNADLGDQTDPGPFIGRQVLKPGKLLVHAGGGCRGQCPACSFKATGGVLACIGSDRADAAGGVRWGVNRGLRHQGRSANR